MAQIILAASGKGGSGKSSFTTGVGRALTALGKKVLAVDCDIGLRSYDIMLDVTAPTLVSTKFYFDKKTPLLDVTAEDNFAVRSITVTDSKGHTAEKTDDGRLDLSKLTGEHIYIDIFDYALNSTVVRLPNPTLELLKPTTAP